MKTRILAAAAALTVLGSLPAAASVITLQTRFSNAPAAPAGSPAQAGAYYQNLVETLLLQAPGAGYCDTTPAAYVGLENSSACGGGKNDNIAFKFEVNFGISTAQAGAISLQIGPDFGKGGAVFLNGALLAAANDDRWWGNNFGSANEVFSLQNIAISAGNHTLSVYGLESCCDGVQSARYRLAGDRAWVPFSTNDALNAVPEPYTAALVLAGLLAMGVAGRKRKG